MQRIHPVLSTLAVVAMSRFRPCLRSGLTPSRAWPPSALANIYLLQHLLLCKAQRQPGSGTELIVPKPWEVEQKVERVALQSRSTPAN